MPPSRRTNGGSSGVHSQKLRGGQPFFDPVFVQLRIGKRDPDLIDFAGSETRIDEFDPRTQESHVLHSVLRRGLGPAPQAGAFDVHPDKIPFRETFAQRHGIFAAPAPQFQNDRSVVPEKIAVPLPF